MVTDITTILKYLNSAFSRIPLKSLTYMFKNKAALLKIQKIPYLNNWTRFGPEIFDNLVSPQKPTAQDISAKNSWALMASFPAGGFSGRNRPSGVQLNWKRNGWQLPLAEWSSTRSSVLTSVLLGSTRRRGIPVGGIQRESKLTGLSACSRARL